MAICVLILGIGSIVSGQISEKYKGVEIRFATQGMPAMMEIIERIPQFEAETGIKVVPDVMSYESMVEKVTLDVQSNTKIYDVFWIEPSWLGRFIYQLEPLDPYIEDPLLGKDFNKIDFPNKVLDLTTYEGRFLGVPLFGGMWLLTYRTDLYENAGLNPANTLDEYLEVVKKLHDPNTVYGLSFMGKRGAGLYWEYLCYAWQFGAELLDEEMHPAINSPEAVEALKYLLTLKEYAPPGVTNWDWTESATAFLQGRVANAILCTDWIPSLQNPNESKVIDKWNFSLIPSKTKSVQVSAGAGMGINADVSKERKEAAFLFVKWMTSSAVLKTLVEQVGGFAVPRLSVLQNPEFIDNPEYFYFGTVAQALSDLRVPMKIAESHELYDTISARLSEALIGKETPEEALKLVEEEWDRILRMGGYY